MSRAPKKVTKPSPEPRARHVIRVPANGQTMGEVVADLATDGVLGAATTMRTFASQTYGDIDLTQATAALRRQIAATRRGDMGIADKLLVGHARALDAIFHECVRRAALNMGEHLDATERYLRLGLKAQSQCRTSLESLAIIKAPRSVAFVKQANIANGPQQVNNGARVEHETEQTELLENNHEVQWLDTGSVRRAGQRNTALATVAPIDRAANGGRQARGKS